MPYLTGISLKQNNSNSVSNLWQNKEPIINRLIYCLLQYVGSFLIMPGYEYPSAIPITINIILILLSLFCILISLIKLAKRKQGYYAITIVLFCILLPFSMNGMRLLNQATHHLMRYAIWLSYIFAYYLYINFIDTKKIKIICTILLSFLILNNIQTANASYVKKTTEQEATLSLMTRVVERIESLNGYNKGVTPVVFIGTPNDYLNSYSFFDEISSITGMDCNSAITYYSQYKKYISIIMRVSMNIIDEEEAYKTIDKESIDAIDSFPLKDSIQIINGIVVVKF